MDCFRLCRTCAEKQKGNANRATLAVARKLVAYLMAVDRGQRNFQVMETSNCVAAYNVAVNKEDFFGALPARCCR